jgi:hypothetical protein
MVFLLLASGGIYFLLGDKQEAIILLGFVVIVVAITLYQENKSGRWRHCVTCRARARPWSATGGAR